ncbi:MAG: AAA family ATPase [Nanoarchaeota archaeon]
MDSFDPIFPKYGLKSDPYFIEPLLIEGGTVTFESFIGRDKESKELHKIISMDGGRRCMVIGEAGVGKTTLVNYVRSQAKKSSYFSPNDEIRIEDYWKVNDVIINTLQSLYMEIKNKGLKLDDPKLMDVIEDLFQLSTIIKDSNADIDSFMSTNTLQLMDLFKKITNQITKSGYRAIIIQYNNFDNIDDPVYLSRLLNNLRDFFMNPNVIFIFIGDGNFPHVISFKSRLRQIFIFPEIQVSTLPYGNVKNIIEKRILLLRLNPQIQIIRPHSEESLRILYELYDGNIRDILNSLSSSVDGNTVMEASVVRTKEILIEKAKIMFLDKVSPTELEILNHIIYASPITNTELAKKFGKPPQNISKYLKKLQNIKAIKIHSVDGRQIFYKASPEAMWLKLKVSSEELIIEKQNQNQRLVVLQKRLKEYGF